MKKILIIDDFAPARKAISRIVKRHNYVSFEAEDGEEGLRVFEKEGPEIVITDINMPHKSGDQLLEDVKQQSPATKVILISGYGDAEAEKELKAKGAFGFLKKPLDIEQLHQMLRNLDK